MKRLLFLFAFALTTSLLFSQNKYTISGEIKDAKTGEALIGAIVYPIELPKVGIATNAYGFFSLSLPEGSYTLAVQYVGYDKKTTPIELNKNIKLNLELAEANTNLKEVVIEGERKDENVTSTQMSAVTLNIKEINKIPVIFTAYKKFVKMTCSIREM